MNNFNGLLSDFERIVLEYIAFNDGFINTRIKARQMLDSGSDERGELKPTEAVAWVWCDKIHEDHCCLSDEEAIENGWTPLIFGETKTVILADERRKKIEAAIKTTERKYFGMYEFDESQHEAVDVIASVARDFLAHSPDREQVGEATEAARIVKMWDDGFTQLAGSRAVDFLRDNASPSRECGEPPAENAGVRNKIAAALHYPDHWDTAAYPTLDDAAWEAIAAAKLTCSECGERQECPHGVDDGACKQCYDEKAALAANQCVHAKGILGDDGGTPCCPLTMTPDASAPTLHDQFEQLNVQNHVYRRAMQKIMARLTELLDEDRFAEIENIVKSVGVEPPAAPQPQADEPKGLTPEWIWGELMDYCKERGVAPALNDRLFKIVERARSLLIAKGERHATDR